MLQRMADREELRHRMSLTLDSEHIMGPVRRAWMVLSEMNRHTDRSSQFHRYMIRETRRLKQQPEIAERLTEYQLQLSAKDSEYVSWLRDQLTELGIILDELRPCLAKLEARYSGNVFSAAYERACFKDFRDAECITSTVEREVEGLKEELRKIRKCWEANGGPPQPEPSLNSDEDDDGTTDEGVVLDYIDEDDDDL